MQDSIWAQKRCPMIDVKIKAIILLNHFSAGSVYFLEKDSPYGYHNSCMPSPTTTTCMLQFFDLHKNMSCLLFFLFDKCLHPKMQQKSNTANNISLSQKNISIYCIWIPNINPLWKITAILRSNPFQYSSKLCILANPLLICTWFLKNQFGKIKFDKLDF